LFVIVLLVFILLSRRLIIGRFYQYRFKKIEDWGRTLDRIVARMGT